MQKNLAQVQDRGHSCTVLLYVPLKLLRGRRDGCEVIITEVSLFEKKKSEVDFKQANVKWDATC